MRRMTTFGLAMVFGMGLLVSAAGAADPSVMLMLGGKFCDFYPKEITAGLMAVKGVKAVDLQSMKGHAVVTHDGSVKPETLVAAVKGVKGTKMGMEWFCTAEPMK
jgi:mercuric ion binding protein